MDAALENMIRELHDKQAIRDVVHNYGRGVDRQDRDLLLSCYHPDAIDDHGLFVGLPGDFFDWTDPSHLRLFATHQHIVTNHTCTLDGDVAHCETYWMFAGMTAAGSKLATYGGRYIDRMEKRDGHWRIAARKCLLEWWGDGLVNPVAIAAHDAVGKIARDKSDVSYERPLKIDSTRVGLRIEP
jgi:ketosteroid isomerase-like protein